VTQGRQKFFGLTDLTIIARLGGIAALDLGSR
jgi:hypothetical protein